MDIAVKKEYELIWITHEDKETLVAAETAYDRKGEYACRCWTLKTGTQADMARACDEFILMTERRFAETIGVRISNEELVGEDVRGYPDFAQTRDAMTVRKVTAYMCPPKCYQTGWFYVEDPQDTELDKSDEVTADCCINVIEKMLSDPVFEHAFDLHHITALQDAVKLLKKTYWEEG